MNTSPSHQPEPLAELLRQAGELDEHEQRRARATFLARFDGQKTRQSSRFRTRLFAPLILTALTLLAFLSVRFFDAARLLDARIGYEVNGGELEGGYIHAAADRAVDIEFTDRSRLTALPGARLRIGDPRKNGADLSIEQGRLHAQITHTGHSDWKFVAGPFQVRVLGTRFELQWDASTERLDVLLLEGAVEIAGYQGAGPVVVRAGQRFSGDAQKRRMSVTDLTLPAPEHASTSSSPKSLDELPLAEETELEEKATDAGSTPDKKSVEQKAHKPWSTWITQGRFQRVVEEAERRGISTCMRTCNESELGALADAARYTGQTGLAEQSLLALRQRFASSAGSRAAFLLGRLFEGRGAATEALRWYETSLREAPRGAFAAESLAGRMRMVQRTQGPAAAQAIARQYLEQHPSGVHANQAHQLLQTAPSQAAP